jgi:hypothetical protein
MMRRSILLLIVAIVAPTGLGAGSASAQWFEGQSIIFGRRTGPQAPWCSNENIGGGHVQEDCSFNSFEQCRRVAMGANNTFCTQNPRYDFMVRPVRTMKSDRLRR